MADPIVTGARVIPDKIDDPKGAYGVEPGGGVRTIVAGMRVVTFAGGTVLTSPDRFAATVSRVIALPSRLGGGFLFQSGTSLWRAERWLAAVEPLVTSPTPIVNVTVGLDRLYVKSQTGAYAAYDAKSGAPLDLGPMPASPLVVAFAAIDAWRAVAIADMRGVVVTSDAGATWRPVSIPIDAHELIEEDGAVAVGGFDSNRITQWWEVRADGQVAPTPAPTPRVPDVAKPVDLALVPATRPFGTHPLEVAIEDGWPLTDGTAVVARDGSIARVRLSDGALLEASADAYPIRPSRCHPLSLAHEKDPTAFGFVCGEKHGATVLYRYDAPSGRMIEKKRFDSPRVVVSSGNGSLVVRGACASGDATTDSGEHAYCLMGQDDTWREIHIRGDVGGERIVALKDGRVVVVSPPHADLATARVTVLDKGKATTVGVAFSPIAAGAARALKYGVWLDGFEERAPGKVGGWVDAGGSVVGVEIGVDGNATVGEYLRDAGLPIASGRFGFGFTSARRAYESTDGGMTWTDVEIPEPLAPSRSVSVRACGPVGCVAAGWLRVGWGDSVNATRLEPAPPPAPAAVATRASRPLDLECEATAPAVPDPPKPPPKTARAAPAASTTPYGYGGGYSSGYGYYGARGVEELPPFFALGAPVMHGDELGVTSDIAQSLDRGGRAGLLGKIYAWGDKAAEWDKNGRWLVRWVWPYGGWSDVRATQTTVAPFASLDDAIRNVGASYGGSQWVLATGDDASHALAIGRRSPGYGQSSLLVLDADRPPLEVRRSDGEPLTEVDAAARVAGHWYVVTKPAQLAGAQTTVIWSLDGSVAHEIARVPRAEGGASNERPESVLLSTRTDGRALGLVVRGQPMERRNASEMWLVPIDVESGGVGEPQALAPDDFEGLVLHACSDDDVGWTLDLPFDHRQGKIHVGATTTSLQQPLARLRIGVGRACIERLASDLDYYGARNVETFVKGKTLAKGAPLAGATIPVAVYTASPPARFALRCLVK
jgi:hypothetical protein